MSLSDKMVEYDCAKLKCKLTGLYPGSEVITSVKELKRVLRSVLCTIEDEVTDDIVDDIFGEDLTHNYKKKSGGKE